MYIFLQIVTDVPAVCRISLEQQFYASLTL